MIRTLQSMRGRAVAAALLLAGTCLASPLLADPPAAKDHAADQQASQDYFKPEETGSDGSVTVGGQKIDYHAVIGTLVVHPGNWDDAPQKPIGAPPGGDDEHGGDNAAAKPGNAEAAMSYVAYFRKGAQAAQRPVMFLFNGGPGSSTVWLHMGAFGPRRVVTQDDQHAPAAPYQIIGNQYSLLDAADLVFIDAPGTGFGRIAGPDKEKAFYGVDQDANAFAEFITNFLTKYGRWNSPKYLFGESYGTTRNAVLVNKLETERSVDVNGVIMLSQVLNFDLGPDGADNNPGVDLPYVLALPTYAATAWYHKKLPDNDQRDLRSVLDEAEEFTLDDYAHALELGSYLDDSDRKVILKRLHDLTGLPETYLDKANLRVTGGEFEKMLQDNADTTTGRFDTRFSGPSMDPLSKEADYDPQSASIGSAYVTAFNDYARHDLHYAGEHSFKAEIDDQHWSFTHVPPGQTTQVTQNLNVMPDLASAMKYNPNLKILLNGGYYDLATPYFAAVWEMRHLPIPRKLETNITIKTYESGHMVYAHEPSLHELHDNVAAFVASTDNVKP